MNDQESMALEVGGPGTQVARAEEVAVPAGPVDMARIVALAESGVDPDTIGRMVDLYERVHSIQDTKVRVVRASSRESWAETDGALAEWNRGAPYLAFPYPEGCPVGPEEYVRLNQWKGPNPIRVLGMPYLLAGKWYAYVAYRGCTTPYEVELPSLCHVPEEGERCRASDTDLCGRCGACKASDCNLRVSCDHGDGCRFHPDPELRHQR